MDYFHEFFPQEAQQETAVYFASTDSSLAGGYYAFLESYCSNPECDCREVVILIEPQRGDDLLNFDRFARPIAVINYAWEKPLSKSNPGLHSDTPKSSRATVALNVFRGYVETHAGYQKKLRQHYAMMKEMGQRYGKGSPIQKETTSGRNELCPCGSGKKFKKCCLNK